MAAAARVQPPRPTNLGTMTKPQKKNLVSQTWEVGRGLIPRATLRLLLWHYPRFIDIGGRVGLVDGARARERERETKRAQWLRFTAFI